MKRCLVVGASGFLGTGLQRDLRHDNAFQLENFGRDRVDLRHPSQVKEAIAHIKPDIIINLAGISSPASQDVMNIYQVNAFGHLHVLQAAAALESKPRVILASSAQLYGPGVLSKATEQTRLNPVSHYGLSKLLAEKYCELFAEGISTIAVRLYNAIGRGQPLQFLIPKVVNAFKRRAPCVELGTLEVERDYIDTRDISAMWRLAMLADKPPTVINFSNGTTATLRYIITRLEQITGHHLEVISKITNLRPNDIPFQCGDNSVIQGLGYVRQHSLDDTLIWMLGDA